MPINRFIDTPIISLQVEAEIARTTEPIVDPRQLVVVGFFVTTQKHEPRQVIHTADIREVSHIGLIVNSFEAIMPLDDLVRLQKILDFEFELLNTPVFDEDGNKYGRVCDYSVDPDSFYVQQLFTQRSFIKSLTSLSQIIHRSQIVSITNEKIIIKSPTVDVEDGVPAKRSLVNPFRPAPQQQGNHSAVESSARRISS